MFHTHRTPLKLAAVSLSTAALAAASLAPTAGAATQGTSQSVAPTCAATLFGACLNPPKVAPAATGGTFTNSQGQTIIVVLPSGPTGPGAACTGGFGWLLSLNDC